MADQSVLTFTRAAESEALSLLLIQSRTGCVEIKSGWKRVSSPQSASNGLKRSKRTTNEPEKR